ncbi:MAG: universal stress protein, partial [Bacteroidota bacterium]|nr:universal stress protein [Bacteroidota bacterium]
LEDGIILQVHAYDYDKAMKVIEDIRLELGTDATKDEKVDIKKILVPVDFSEHSINACYYAIELASLFKAEIRLFHSYYIPTLDAMSMGESPIYSSTIDEHLQSIKDSATENIEMLNKSLQEHVEKSNIKGILIDYKLEKGFAEDEIFDEYNNYEPDIIVMGTSGRNEKKKYLYGSVTAEVIENVKVPVFAIPSKAKGGLQSFKKIMYATRFDETDFRAVHKLIYLVSPFDMQIHFVHISSEKDEKMKGEQVELIKERLRKANVSTDIKIDTIESADIVESFDGYIRKNDIDIVSMVTHKRNFITRWLNPSLTRKMLFHSNTPLLVFH